MPLAITAPSAAVSTTANTSTYAMGAFTPSPNALLVMFSAVDGSTALGTVTGGGLTWTRKSHLIFNAGVDSLQVHWAYTGASPASCTPTIDVGSAATGCNQIIFEITGCDITSPDPFVQFGSGNGVGNEASVTLPGPLNSSNGYLAAFAAARISAAGVPPPGWTQNGDVSHSLPGASISGGYRALGETLNIVRFGLATGTWAMTALEVRAPVEQAEEVFSGFGFNNTRNVAAMENDGYGSSRSWRKAPTQPTGNAAWFDLSMSPGNPIPNYYASTPLVARALAQSTDFGLNHGGNVAPMKKRLRRFFAVCNFATAVPMPIVLQDYLLYYPFLDEGVLDEQLLDNTVSMTRWTDGVGVQIMAVVAGAHTGGQAFRVRYTNSDGVPNRLTRPVVMGSNNSVGIILSLASFQANVAAPYLPLQPGDKGVRSIQGFQMLGEDVGLLTLVLVKPLAAASIRGVDAPVEIDYLTDMPQLPLIADDAYLNIICAPLGNFQGGQMNGVITTVWS